METKPQEKKSASFLCNRIVLQSFLSTMTARKDSKLTISTHLAEQNIVLNGFYETPIPCSECKGDDAVFTLPLLGLKKYCKLINDETLRFTLEGNTLQINSTILTVKANYPIPYEIEEIPLPMIDDQEIFSATDANAK